MVNVSKEFDTIFHDLIFDNINKQFVFRGKNIGSNIDEAKKCILKDFPDLDLNELDKLLYSVLRLSEKN